MQPAGKSKLRKDRPKLRLVRPVESSGHVRYWLINGYLASIQCWTEKEFEELHHRPEDAVFYPEGVWVSLRWN